jgi:hypothetical protein
LEIKKEDMFGGEMEEWEREMEKRENTRKRTEEKSD